MVPNQQLRRQPKYGTGDPVRTAIALVIITLLAGCSSATTGMVTSKQYIPQHEEFSYFQCYMYDAKAQCTMQMPVYETVDQCWQVNFHNAAEDKNGSACVDQTSYDRYRVGDQYPALR